MKKGSVAFSGSVFIILLTVVLGSCGGGSSGNNGGGGGGNPPATPTGLTASAGNAQVVLSWNASSGATAYSLGRSTTSGGAYTNIASPSATDYTDNGLTNGTTYYYVVAAVDGNGASANSAPISATPSVPTTAVNVTIDVHQNRHAISQFIYGTNFPNNTAYLQDTGTTLVRWGGNASTRYNWTSFNTNAAADWYFSNRPMCTSPSCDTTLYSDSAQFVTNVRAAGAFPLVTVGMLPWVAKDASSYSFSASKYGYTPCHANPYNSDDGDGVLFAANCDASPAYLTGNDPHDADVPLLDGPPQTGDPAGSVYRNQWVAALATAFGGSSTVGHLYNMDNEIDIWGSTHRDVHPNPSSYSELRDTFLSESRALRGWDPEAYRFGPVSCCWDFYWNSAAGSADKAAHGGVDFLPWWLNEVRWLDSVNTPVVSSLDVFDVHAYTEASATGLPLAQQQALALRITRDWWDPSYTSEAWFGTNSVTANEPLDSKPFRIPRLRAWLNTIYPPGSPLSFTEWNFAMAGESDFSTALADVDAWGILGRENVQYAARWAAADPSTPAYNSLKLYRNYDGAHHTFNPTSVSATHNADPGLFSVYAAANLQGTSLTIMVVNKDPAHSAAVQFALNGFTPSQVTSYTLSQASPMSIVGGTPQSWSSSVTFAPYSATLLVLTGTTAQLPAAEWELNPDTIVVPAAGTATLAPHLLTLGYSGTLTLGSPTSDAGITVTVTNSTISPAQPGAVSVAAGNTPGFYKFSIPAIDGTGVTTTQSGWILVGNPAATLTKTGDNQTGPVNTTLNLSVTLSPGQSGGTATGASVRFSTNAGSLSSGAASGTQVVATTNNSGVAAVTLTLPATAEPVQVTAEGPYGLGHPVVTFTETAQ